MKLKDWIILIAPVVALALVMLLPFIPDSIPMQFTNSGEVIWSMPKWVFPLVGILPFIIYKRYTNKK